MRLLRVLNNTELLHLTFFVLTLPDCLLFSEQSVCVVFVHVFACTCGGQRKVYSVFLSDSLLISLSQSLSLNIELLARLAASKYQ